MLARLSPRQAPRQVNDTRRSVVGGLAHTDRWQTEVDEVATVNQYEPTGKPLSCVIWLLRGSYPINNYNKSADQRWKFSEIARTEPKFPRLLLQTQR